MSQHPGKFIAEAALPAGAAAELAPAARPRRRLRPLLYAAAGLAALAAGAAYARQYWTVGRFEVSTDDAYVQADTTTIAPKVSGYIGRVLVGDNEAVKAGQALARIDDRDYRVALDQAKADVASAEATIQSKRATLATQRSVIDSANGHDRRRSGEPDLRRAGGQALRRPRRQRLRHGAERPAGGLPHRRRRAIVTRDTAALDAGAQAGRRAEGRASRRPRPRWRTRRRSERQAELNLSYTSITAPVDGVVGNRTLRVGQYVQARHAADGGGAGRRRLHRRQLQGDAAHRRAGGARRSRSRSTCFPAASSTAMSTAWRRRAARNSRCCRPTTPPATSPRSCSASR